MNIPPLGWVRVAEGCVKIGDQIWAKETQRFITVDEACMRDLEFLAALDVRELILVIRPEETK